MYVQKGNIQLTVTDAEAKAYVDNGYDLYDDKGKLQQTGKGKTISWEMHEKLMDEAVKNAQPEDTKELNAKVKELEKALKNETKRATDLTNDYEKVEAANADLQTKLEEAEKKLAEADTFV